MRIATINETVDFTTEETVIFAFQCHEDCDVENPDGSKTVVFE